MRQLVYRVQALPQSMLPLVWDFGQLAKATEELYIKQMVNRYVSNIFDLHEIVMNVIHKKLAEGQICQE